MTLNVVDSSGWLEYFADGPNANFFAPPIEEIRKLVVPTICFLEVFKRVMVQRGEVVALQAVGQMRQGHVVALTEDLALEAARLGAQTGLPLADSIILATGRISKAIVWTQNADFKGLPGVKYIEKGKG